MKRLLLLLAALLVVAPAYAAPSFTGPFPVPTLSAPAPVASGDDGAPLTAAAARAATAGKGLYVGPGTYTLATSIAASVANTKIYLSPSTVFKMAMSSGGAGGTNNSAFTAFYTTPGSPFTTTLAADTAANSPTISTHAKPAVGTWLYLSSGSVTNVGWYCLVQASTGSGDPYTVTCSTPVPYPSVLVSGASVVQQNPVTGLEIHGGGAVVSGTGDRVFEGACQGCLVEGLRVDNRFGVPGSILFSCDVGSADCTFRDLAVDCGGSCVAAVACESAQRCVIDSVRVRNGGNSATAGFYFPDAIDSTLINSSAHNFYVGALVNTGATPTTAQGSRRVSIIGSSFTGNGGAGVQIQSPETSVIGSSFAGNVGHGVMVGFGSALSFANGKPAQLVGITGQSNKGALIHVTGGDVLASNVTSSDDGVSTTLAAVNIPSGGSNVTLTGGYITLATDVSQYGVYANGSGRVRLSDVTFAYPASPVAASACLVSQGTNPIEAARTRCSGGYFGFYFYGTGSTFVRGPGVTWSGTQSGGALTVTGGSFQSWGTLTCNSTTAVNVSLPLISANSIVTVGGSGYLFSLTAGTGFAAKCATGDTTAGIPWTADGL